MLELLSDNELAADPPGALWDKRTVDDASNPKPSWGLRDSELLALKHKWAVVELHSRIQRVYPGIRFFHMPADDMQVRRNMSVCPQHVSHSNHPSVEQTLLVQAQTSSYAVSHHAAPLHGLCEQFVANAAVAGNQFLWHVDADPSNIPVESPWAATMGLYANRVCGLISPVFTHPYKQRGLSVYVEAAGTYQLCAQRDRYCSSLQHTVPLASSLWNSGALFLCQLIDRRSGHILPRHAPCSSLKKQRTDRTSRQTQAGIGRSAPCTVSLELVCVQEAGRPRFVSLIAYLNSSWGLNEHAETLFLDSSTDTGAFVRPKPGRVVLLDQDILHRASAPAAAAGRPRYSLVWKLLACPADAAASGPGLAGGPSASATGRPSIAPGTNASSRQTDAGDPAPQHTTATGAHLAAAGSDSGRAARGPREASPQQQGQPPEVDAAEAEQASAGRTVSILLPEYGGVAAFGSARKMRDLQEQVAGLASGKGTGRKRARLRSGSGATSG